MKTFPIRRSPMELSTLFCWGLLWLGVLLTSAFNAPQAWALSWQMDPMGYHPLAPKQIIVDGIPEDVKDSVKFTIVDPDAKDTFYYITQKLGKDLGQATVVKVLGPDTSVAGPRFVSMVLDISHLQKNGSYAVRVEGLTKTSGISLPTNLGKGDPPVLSPSIRISEFLFWDPLQPVLRSFYFNRSGFKLDDPQTGIFVYPGHTADGTLLESDPFALSNSRDVTGGWYATGQDYSKYTTLTSLTVSKLLSTYEWNPKPFKFLKLDYPATEDRQDRLPDILYEARVGLDWLMAMQRQDGAFFRKVTGQTSSRPTVLPSDDTQGRVIYGVTTQDTAMATAALAQAARVYKKADLGYSVKCLLAAEQGWMFLSDKTSEGSKFYISPDNRLHKDYLSPNDNAYRTLAAIELYLATGNPVYHDYLLAHYTEVPVEPISWRNPLLIGLMDYATVLAPERKSKALDDAIRNRIFQLAQSIKARANENLYPVHPQWIGNETLPTLMERATVLLFAYRLNQDDSYRATAAEMFHFIMGVNPWGKTFVTGLTPPPTIEAEAPTDPKTPPKKETVAESLKKPAAPPKPKSLIQFPAHYVFSHTKKMIPGLLVNGPIPNPSLGNSTAGQRFKAGPLKQTALYEDTAKAGAENQTAIHWNASLAFTLGALNSAYNMAGTQLEGEPSLSEKLLKPEPPNTP